ncbi:Hsp90 protein-domain-containing protein [Globomyces pollinis-pini]|nr:Hsp90 protein-domain-containing protein [Globomyces pollinis-pini]
MKLLSLLSIPLLINANLDLPDLKNHEVFTFETEVNKVMDIIIHSLYKTKDVFLRELISNASDAIDKIRFASITDKSVLDSNPDLKITVKADKVSNTLMISDTGIGMTKDGLKNNLGTIAKSGTAEFLKAIEENNSADPGLIGQFGVGFYSAFLVADKVTVISKNNDDDQYIWESNSQNNFKLVKDPRGNTLGRGTSIILHLKPDAVNFLEQNELQNIIRKHSEFINFPIYLWTEKTIEEPVEEETGETTMTFAKPEDESDVQDVTEDKEPEDETPKTVSKTVQEWELMNEHKPIWTRKPSDITQEEYHTFYKGYYKDSKAPLGYSHFKLEGDKVFTGLIYIPEDPPKGFMTAEGGLIHNVQLFVRRIFITDDLVDFLPKWLGFLKVLIDSDDLPLNVSRETLQSHHSLKPMKKKIISKALDLLVDLAENDLETFTKIHDKYKQAFRYGLHEANTRQREKIMKLLRFQSSEHRLPTTSTSLQEYVDRMQDKQPQIYFVAGVSAEYAHQSPFAASVIAKGYEVLYFSDPIEEYLTTTDALKVFNDIPLQNVANPGLKFGNEDEESEEKEKEYKEHFKPLTEWLETKLKKYVSEVRVSSNLGTAPFVVLPGMGGLTPTQERMLVLEQQGARKNPMFDYYMSQKKILDINPTHPIVESLLDHINSGRTDDIKLLPKLIYHVYAIGSGYDIRDPTTLLTTFEPFVRKALNVDLIVDNHVEPVDEGHAEL